MGRQLSNDIKFDAWVSEFEHKRTFVIYCCEWNGNGQNDASYTGRKMRVSARESEPLLLILWIFYGITTSWPVMSSICQLTSKSIQFPGTGRYTWKSISVIAISRKAYASRQQIIKYFQFWFFNCYSGCRSQSQSLADTFFGPSVVHCCRKPCRPNRR